MSASAGTDPSTNSTANQSDVNVVETARPIRIAEQRYMKVSKAFEGYGDSSSKRQIKRRRRNTTRKEKAKTAQY